MRVGIGFDVHRLEEGLPLWIGGLRFDHPRGAVAHSDGDVLIHALCDALLGAAGLPDIGTRYPDTDERWRGARGETLLADCAREIAEHGFSIRNVDAVVFAQAPRIAPHREAMVANLARILEVAPQRVGVKATTTEGLGVIGTGEAIAAQAVASLRLSPSFEDIDY
ncbi:MAG: 2-C-methyl-D-erythritol 2,4-cyclodiphosphate synthase [Planctomycetes bacterium]|nr:2-C-methyl-D-erythritol 2,4-cyclodiphosphate synthase [Planctomycetota bacterium]